jgi:hypothetical protein
MNRNSCVICNSNILNDIYTLENYPITPSSNNLDYSTDEFQDCTFLSCNSCGCVQLKTLIDPIKLYLNSHNSTHISSLWKEHHTLFADFIIKHNKLSELIEVGGNSGILYNLLSSAMNTYTILDISDTETRPSEVKFVQGNCENFNFTGHNSVVLSHTFEHLYSPRLFIQNLHSAKVDSIFISIPNMEEMCSSENMSILHNEHTYYIGNYEIKYMFSQFNYYCNSSYEYKTHSRFYHFRYMADMIPLSLIPSFSYRDRIIHIFSKYPLLIKNININTPCYICPAGHYGQKIYYYLKNFHKSIKGFLDNDPLKQNKRLYGTPLYIYSPNILATESSNKIYIILYAGPYINEIKKQLDMIHTNITFINI